MKKLLLILVASVCCLSLFTQDALLVYRHNYLKPLFVALKDVTTISHSDTVQVLSLEEWNIQAQSLASDIDSIVFIDSDTIYSVESAYFLCPDDRHPHLIDLGLPSGTLWTCCNVGATKPEEYGGYYAWGETDEKDYYHWSTYQNIISAVEEESYGYIDGYGNFDIYNIGNNIARTEYDVAYVKMCDFFSIPSISQVRELISCCNFTWMTLNGVNGILITGTNNATIFLPAAGDRYKDVLDYDGSLGHYWSSNLYNNDDYDGAYDLWFGQGIWGCEMGHYKYLGFSIRPVCSANPIPDISISDNYVELFIDESTIIEITSGSGNYEISNSQPDVVEATLTDTTITLIGKSIGISEVIVKDSSSGQTANIIVAVSSHTGHCPDEHHPHLVDLGLSSGTKWACCNVGASEPEGYGGYYAWGETEEKDEYSWSTYIHCDGSEETCHDIGEDIAGTDYDVAHAKWGGTWRMPTNDQIKELKNKCMTVKFIRNKVYGLLVIGPNGSSIFMPLPGNSWRGILRDENKKGYYWSSTIHPDHMEWAWCLQPNYDWGEFLWGGYYRANGLSVRPVSTAIPLPNLTLSKNSVSMMVGNSSTVEITSGSGNYEFSISNNDVVEVTLDGTTITLKGLSEGAAVVTVKDISSGQTARIDVTVTSPSSPSNEYPEPEAIDLGLPSGTKWASWNVGASKPEEKGGYFAWGETEEKDHYWWDNYKYRDGTEDTYQHLGNDIAGTEYDVAHVKWGGSWQMPSFEQFEELMTYCKSSEIYMNSVPGTSVTGPNGNSIFFPDTGKIGGNSRNYYAVGYYWSSAPSLYVDTLAYAFFSSYDTSNTPNKIHRYERLCGLAIRAVQSPPKKPKEYPVAEAIDLGLPSGTKWASWNVGASAPEDIGSFYAWGETEEKYVYTWKSYIHCDGTSDYCHYLGEDIAGTEYDVAHVKWGGEWRMPSRDQINELLLNCTITKTISNDVEGYLFTGPNGSSIFLPYTKGQKIGDACMTEHFNGTYYWSSTYNYESSSLALIALLDYSYAPLFHWSHTNRYEGLAVRAVIGSMNTSQEYPVAEAIDLGLSSGTKWASWNVGASKPEEYGGYFAWGETDEKDYYNWSTYNHCGSSSYSSYYTIGNKGDISGTGYDVAKAKWGGEWRMPSNSQMDELRKQGTWLWTTRNDVNGYLVTGPNGASIFLPAAGFRHGEILEGDGQSGNYWESKTYIYKWMAQYFYFKKNKKTNNDGENRDYGLTVRPVHP